MDETFETEEWRIVGWILDPAGVHCHEPGCEKRPSILLSHWGSLEFEPCCNDHEPPGLHDPIAETMRRVAEKLPKPQ